jgi:pseudouridine-5'-phosphate glycosidase
MNQHFNIAAPVAATLNANGPVVALESTVISHGLPAPINLTTANKLEEIVSSAGASPATVAIIGGQLRVGLSQDELQLLATGSDIKKVSTRDLPIAVTQKWNGATTVASTSWIAHRAGIRAFATGGIGGVHRGDLPDISADLPELARTPIIVVCSGAKIVLDLPATREWLETHGVTVIGYRCDEMPAFYSRTNGLPVDVRVDSPGQVSQLFNTQQQLKLNSALLVCVPVPEEFEVPAKQLQEILDHALAAADKNGVHGRDLTPYLLAQMSERSAGSTLRANIALLENNAHVAAEIALALQQHQ